MQCDSTGSPEFPDTYQTIIQKAVSRTLSKRRLRSQDIREGLQQDAIQATYAYLLKNNLRPSPEELAKIADRQADKVRRPVLKEVPLDITDPDADELRYVCDDISLNGHRAGYRKAHQQEWDTIAHIDRVRAAARAIAVIGRENFQWLVAYEDSIYDRPCRHTRYDRKRACLLRKKLRDAGNTFGSPSPNR